MDRPLPRARRQAPSLSIRETVDGKVLVKCWTGCSVDEVVAAAGLELGDLFPERPSHRGKPERRPFPAADVLRAVGREVLLVAVSASRLGNGGALTDEDRARLLLAAARIGAAVERAAMGAADLAASRGNEYLDRIAAQRSLEPRNGA